MTASAAGRTTSVYELVSRLSATKGLKEMLDEVLSASLALLQVDMGYLALYKPQTEIAARRGLPDSFLDFFQKHAPVPVRELPPGVALATGKRVIVQDVYSHEAFRPYLPVVEQAGFVSMQATPLITRGGQAVGMICTHSRVHDLPSDAAFETLDLYAGLAADLIEREQTKEALSLSEERFRLATEGAKVYPWELNLKTNKVWYIGGKEHPRPTAELVELEDVLKLIHPLDRRRVIRAVLRAQEKGSEFTLEHRGTPGDEGALWYQVSGEVIRDAEGRPERLVGVSHDVTERKRTESLLQESEERFRGLYDLTLRISKTQGLQEAFDEILNAVIQLLGASSGHLWLSGEDVLAPPFFAASQGVSREYLDYVQNLPHEELAGGLAHEAQATRKLAFAEDVFTHPTFQHHSEAMQRAGIASMFAWPLLGRAGNVIGVLTTHFSTRHVPSPEQLQTLELYGRLAVDTVEREEQLSRQREAEAALRDALALRNEFLGLVSHELRTPMTIIRGLASVLDRQELEQEDLSAVYRDLRDESERLYWLIENMLRLARVEAGQRPDTDDLLLRRTLESIITRIERNYPSLDLRVEMPPSDIIVSAIETYVEQVLHNLLQNAAKYNRRSAPIDITTRLTGRMVEIRVADRGVGVKDVDAVFQPFQREERAEKRATGLGLGLAVCKALIEAQGGQIWVEQRAGGGSEFCFTLPTVAASTVEPQ
jgi:signal transduction histidine kinase